MNTRPTDAQSIAPYVDLLREVRLQLEYLDERFPTGTTPTAIAKIDALLSGQQPAPGIDVERLPDDEAAALRIIDKAFRDAGLKRPFFGEAYEPGVVVKSIVEQVALHTPAPAEVRALAGEIEAAIERFHDAVPQGQGEIGDGGAAGRALCQLFYDNSETICRALRHTSTATAEDAATAIRKLSTGSEK